MHRIKEKHNALDNLETGKSIQAVRSLQKQHANIERELKPVEEEMNKVNLLAST